MAGHTRLKQTSGISLVDIFNLERGKATVLKDVFNVRWVEDQLRE